MASLTYLGHSAFLIEGSTQKLLVDPFLAENPLATRSPNDVTCDYIIVTHGHGDHLGDTVAIAKRNNATVISNYEVATWLSQQGVAVHGMHIGGAFDFSFGRVKLTMALHGSGLNIDGTMLYMGNPTGALITIDDKMIYHAGDTGLFYDMNLIGAMNAIDVALLPIGDNFTMGIDDAAKAVEFLNPQLAIPMHFNTFDVIRVNPQEFVRKVSSIGKTAKVLAVNEVLQL